jgi:hypothetical protein
MHTQHTPHRHTHTHHIHTPHIHTTHTDTHTYIPDTPHRHRYTHTHHIHIPHTQTHTHTYQTPHTHTHTHTHTLSIMVILSPYTEYPHNPSHVHIHTCLQPGEALISEDGSQVGRLRVWQGVGRIPRESPPCQAEYRMGGGALLGAFHYGSLCTSMHLAMNTLISCCLQRAGHSAQERSYYGQPAASRTRTHVGTHTATKLLLAPQLPLPPRWSPTCSLTWIYQFPKHPSPPYNSVAGPTTPGDIPFPRAPSR